MSISSPFIISFWAGPPNAETTIERYKEIKAAGFTTVCSAGNDDSCREDTQAVLATAAELGLSAIISDYRITLGCSDNTDHLIDQAVRDWGHSPALLGYFITDEPRALAFADLKRIVRRLRSKDPSRLTFINLLPTYAEDFRSDAEYAAYITDYLNVVNPNIVSFDHYPTPIQPDDKDSHKTRFTNNLRIIRDLSLQRNKSFWTIIEACTMDAAPNNAILEPLMRWQAMEALRYGTRGILYFLYWKPSIGNYGQGMINLATGRPNERYYDVKKLNSDIHAVVIQEGEVLFGRVRATTSVPAGEGDLWLINTKNPSTDEGRTTARQLIARDFPHGQVGAGWDWRELTMPGYGLVNFQYEPNGFWLSARHDLLNKTFYVLNVIDDGHGGLGRLYTVTRNSVSEPVIAGWNDIPADATRLGTYFAVDGFWVAIKDS